MARELGRLEAAQFALMECSRARAGGQADAAAGSLAPVARSESDLATQVEELRAGISEAAQLLGEALCANDSTAVEHSSLSALFGGSFEADALPVPAWATSGHPPGEGASTGAGIAQEAARACQSWRDPAPGVPAQPQTPSFGPGHRPPSPESPARGPAHREELEDLVEDMRRALDEIRLLRSTGTAAHAGWSGG